MSQERKARLDHKEFLARLELPERLVQLALPEQLEALDLLGPLDKPEQQARLAPLVRRELPVLLDQQDRLEPPELQGRPGQPERFQRI